MCTFVITCVLFLMGICLLFFSGNPVVALMGLGVCILGGALFKKALIKRKLPNWVYRFLFKFLKD